VNDRYEPRALDRRQFLARSLGTAGLIGAGSLSASALLAACSNDSANKSTTTAPGTSGPPSPFAGPPTDLASALPAPGSPGLVDEAAFQTRVDDFVRFATAELDVESPTGIAAQLVRAHREPDYTWDTSAATVASLQEVWDRFDGWQDVRDFRLMYLHWVLELADGNSPSTTLDPGLLATIRVYMIGNRYRYDDPLPDDVIDSQWFWSENHIIIGLVSEYLAGKRFPDDVFTITGLTGTEHLERSRQPILDWVDERARFGFFEWHSHVYMLKNITPLLTLAEFADDPELVRAAAMALDLCLLDMASHTHRGTYTATRGRSYKADKMTARDEDTFTINKLLFDDTDLPYQTPSDTGAVFLSAAKRYRPPQALIDIAVASQPGVVRERHGIFVDGAAPVTADPEAPFGYDFDDPANLTFWWSQGALGLWQVADVSLAEAARFRIFDTSAMAPIKVLVDLNGSDPVRVKAWEQANHDVVNFGQLREANTYAWRGDHVSLATVVDHRFGQMRDQIHAWSAAIDADAVVFTNHPRSGLKETTDWGTDDKPGYWTGEASMPRSAQHERTAVHIYQPAWDDTIDPLLWSFFKYRDYTHAYFPQDHFDEVNQVGHWTVGRRGDGCIALWSWREPSWREYDASKVATNGMVQPFDLMAEGGADNVWIVEVGEQTDSGFATWLEQVTSSEPIVSRSTAGFTVAWTSPSAGDVAFGSTDDFMVNGEVQQLGEYPRHSSNFGNVDRLSKTYALETDGARLRLEFDSLTRAVN
jgi:hypothetical protein